MDKTKIAAEIIKKIIYINIATVCEDGSPWNSPVYTAFDDKLNFYWASSHSNVRSKNIELDGRTFVTIYDSTAPEGTGEGVYFKGETEVLEDFERIEAARKCTQSRKGKEAEENAGYIFSGNSKRKIYCFTPKQAWINDGIYDEEGNFVHDIRSDINLADIRKLL